MKISKTTVLALGVMFSAASLGLILVDAGDVDVLVDPSNAIQHIKNVRFISTGNNTAIATMKAQNKNNIVQISMDGNFILSKTGDLSKAGDDEINMILGSGLSSILGGIKNKIWENFRGNSVILAGSGNGISSGGYSVILGGEGNNIVEPASTIVGGRDNAIGTKGEGFFGNVIIGGENSRVLASYSVAAGNNNEVAGNSSVALGSGAILGVDNTFLWTNSESVEGLGVNDVFVVDANSGMVVNEDRAHSFARLTLGGALSVFSNVDDENIQCGGGVGGGILKAVTTDTNQMCLCSCDGSGWNSMFARGRCVGACNGYMEPECGNTVERVCGEDGTTYSGSCIRSKAINGEGSYLVDKNDKIHRSCQADDGSVKYCSGFVSSAAERCDWYCKGELPLNSQLNGRAMTNHSNVSFFYDPTSTGDCAYSCKSGFNYVVEDGENLCVKCQAGTYDEISRTCVQEAVCEDGKVPYSGGCIYLGQCLNKAPASLFKIKGIEQFNGYATFGAGYPNFRPYGGNVEENWTCKTSSGEVHPHSCEFSCNDGYHCAIYSWGSQRHAYCASNDLGCLGYHNKPPSGGTIIINPQFGVYRWHHPVYNSEAQLYNVSGLPVDDGEYLSVEYVSSLDDLEDKINKRIEGCYSFCDLGFHESSYTIAGHGMYGDCVSNCKDMRLGAVVRTSGLDMHLRNDAAYITGWFYNGRFERTPNQYIGRNYVSPQVLDDAVANNSGICLWTCRSGIPIKDINTVSPFKETFNYVNPNIYQYNTCWEECPDNHYFSGFKCVSVSSNQYIPDRNKTITYENVVNPIAEIRACEDTDDTYQGNQCVRNFTSTGCPEGYKKVGDKCITCRVGQGFSGDSCVDYDRCDVNHNRRINLNDKVSIYNCTMSGTLCNGRENLDGMGGVNSGDLEYFDEICTTKLDYNVCDINDDGLFDTNDTHYISQYIHVCQDMNNCSLVYDFDGNGEVNILDVVEFGDICVRQGG